MARQKKGEPGHKEATNRWRATMIAKYGKDGLHKKMQEIGRIGGTRSGTGGFYNDPSRAREAGRLGGMVSRIGYKIVKWEGNVVHYKNKSTGEIEVRKIDV